MANRVVSQLPSLGSFSLLFEFNFTDVACQTLEEKESLQMSLLNLIRVYYAKQHNRMLENCEFDVLYAVEAGN